jgi:hypothetical protein
MGTRIFNEDGEEYLKNVKAIEWKIEAGGIPEAIVTFRNVSVELTNVETTNVEMTQYIKKERIHKRRINLDS